MHKVRKITVRWRGVTYQWRFARTKHWRFERTPDWGNWRGFAVGPVVASVFIGLEEV
jgi:hypothetical protein